MAGFANTPGAYWTTRVVSCNDIEIDHVCPVPYQFGVDTKLANKHRIVYNPDTALGLLAADGFEIEFISVHA